MLKVKHKMKIKHSVAKVNLFDLLSAPHFFKKKHKKPMQNFVKKIMANTARTALGVTYSNIIYRT